MKEFNILFSIRKGLWPDRFDKNIPVGLDDLPDDLSEPEIRQMAINQAEKQLYNSEDYIVYGKNWVIKQIYES